MRSVRRTTLAAVLTVLVGAGVTAVAAAGAAHAARPSGAVSSLAQYGSGIRVTGWAHDGDHAGTSLVFVRVDGVRRAHGRANGYDAASRTDRRFDIRVALPAGRHRICATTPDYPATNKLVVLGCRTLTLDYDPIGILDGPTQTPGHLTVSGWTIDRESSKSTLNVAVRVDGTTMQTVRADRPYPGLHTSHPLAGDDHGFRATVPIAEGSHVVCAVALNLYQGHDASFCVSRTISFSPSGGIRTVSQIPGGLHIEGYAKDPDTTATTSVSVSSNGVALGTLPADGSFGHHPGYGFRGDFRLPGTALAPGTRTICVTATNLGTYGHTRQIACWAAVFDFNPRVAVATPTQQMPGASVSGWAVDPDTTDPVTVHVTGDGVLLATLTADGAGGSHPGHMFRTVVPFNDGTHRICVTAVNLSYGSGDSAPSCSNVRLNFSPYGVFESVTRAPGSTDVVATGWAIDRSTSASIIAHANLDGGAATAKLANISRPDVAARHPGTGTRHGFAIRLAADDKEHRVCTRAMNSGNGLTSPLLGCKIINAVHPKPASAVRSVSAVAGYGGARIVWQAPVSDGGAPWTSYTVRTMPSGPSKTVGAGTLATTVLGLKPSTRYSFSVVANNVAGASAPSTSPVVITEKEPPAQTTPAPVSTSRYIRNVRGATSTDLTAMRREGAADARANRSGHAYLVLLAVGGQDESRRGVVLTAGIRFVSYADMVRDLKAYVDGYASAQQVSAPATLAVQTNNDIDVSRSSGANFARQLVIPLRSYAARYPGITVAGSDDMEPGFRASYAQTSSWLSGFLATTKAPFVFSGSADGCAWTRVDRGCNNGWTMRGMYHLAAASVRVLGLPQIYNLTMAKQWRYISLTGVGHGGARVNFGGALTEYTACAQARSCGSLTGHTAWSYLWTQLRAESQLKPRSLPYSTDLRIDR